MTNEAQFSLVIIVIDTGFEPCSVAINKLSHILINSSLLPDKFLLYSYYKAYKS